MASFSYSAIPDTTEAVEAVDGHEKHNDDRSTADVWESFAQRVTPKQVEKLQKTVQKQHDVANSPEYNPPEGKNLYFDDGKRRIDYILAWKISDKQETEDDNADCRTIFTRNLEEEGLHLEYTEPDQKGVYYLKIHAPYEVLTRYAEITKTRMPIKELPQQHQPDGFLEVMSVYVSNLLSPFDLNPLNVPPIPKKYTSMFERNKEYLFDIPDNKELFFSHGIRSRLVDYILRRKRYVEDQHDYYSFGIKQLLSKDVYDAAYPLHEGDYQTNSRMNMRRLLHDQWSSWRKWYKRQPLNHIRVYFGEKIGFYFAWLGFYTYSLLPASIVGLLVFIYGCSTISLNVSVQEGCDWNNNFTMCPLCNKRCPYWNYASVCGHMEATHIFDNSITVIFALFMSLWGTLFLEFWKREQAELQFKWNVSGFEEEEETPRPEYLAKMSRSKHKRTDAVTGESEPYIPAKNKIPIYCVSITTMALLVIVAVAVVIAIIVYRMAVAGALILQEKEVLYNNAPMVTSSTAAIIQLIAIIILTVVYNKVAVMLTDWECPRTDTDYDNSLTFKLYLLQFVNYYSSLFYIAFFKGRFRTNPGDYSALQSEQCSGGGCLIDLCIQLGIIFVGKMLIQNNFMEIFLPRIIAWFKGCCASDDFDPEQAQPWEEDRQLKHRGKRALFDEYLEMLLQFGFVTLFVAAFPLAPFFAWLNNIIEIRADANKFVAQYRRPVAMRAETIGVWYNVLVGVSRLAILTNAFIIAITSGFVHRMVYLIEYSEDGRLTGYTNYTLSYFNVSDYHEDSVPDDPDGEYQDIELCRYRDYREPPWADNQYEYTSTFWNVLAAQFIFVVVFENLVILITVSIAFFIPDVPSKLQQQIRREAYITNEIILKTELKITRGEDAELSEKQRATIRRRTTALGSVPPPDTDTFTELHTIAESNV